MAKSDTIFIAFKNGGRLPKEITGGEEKVVPPHEAVRVPRTYGESLIEDRFAYLTEAQKKAPSSPTTSKPEGGPDRAALEDAVAQAELDLATATDDDAKSAAELSLAKAKEDLAKAQG